MASIQMTDYFVTDLHISANPKFDPKKEVPMDFDNFQVDLAATPQADDKRAWQICLKLQFQPAAEANVAYRFTVDVVGLFIVHPQYDETKVERLVKTNGPSMLYGALREVMRNVTGLGPYSTGLLPSTSFYEPPEKQPEPVLIGDDAVSAPATPTTAE